MTITIHGAQFIAECPTCYRGKFCQTRREAEAWLAAHVCGAR